MHKKGVDKLNTLSHPFAWYGDDIWSVGENHVNLQLVMYQIMPKHHQTYCICQFFSSVGAYLIQRSTT